MGTNCSGCGNVTCNCSIISGDGVNVSGIGSGAAPYIPKAVGDPAGPIVVTAAGINIDMCLFGDNLDSSSLGRVVVQDKATGCLTFLENGSSCQILALSADGDNAVWANPIEVLSLVQEVVEPLVGETVVTSLNDVRKVYRNGLLQLEGIDFTVVGGSYTFSPAFGISDGAAGQEIVVLESIACQV
jgi:hypothetical protein